MQRANTRGVAARAGVSGGGDESGCPTVLPNGTHGAALSNEAFLGIIGRRVRSRRASLHMTRRRLAAGSGVSERYLAQLESGQGNMSISLLRKVAFALSLPLTELVAEDDADLADEAFVAAAAEASGVPTLLGRCPAKAQGS